jgi:hypothetical protein
MRRIRELFADFIAVLHDSSATGWYAAIERALPVCGEVITVGGSYGGKSERHLAGHCRKDHSADQTGWGGKSADISGGAEPLYEEIRIENSLQSPNGEQVRLKQGAEVEVIVEAGENAVTSNSEREKLWRLS